MDLVAFLPSFMGDERGISGFFASLAAFRLDSGYAGREKISGTVLSNILNGRFTGVRLR